MLSVASCAVNKNKKITPHHAIRPTSNQQIGDATREKKPGSNKGELEFLYCFLILGNLDCHEGICLIEFEVLFDQLCRQFSDLGIVFVSERKVGARLDYQFSALPEAIHDIRVLGSTFYDRFGTVSAVQFIDALLEEVDQCVRDIVLCVLKVLSGDNYRFVERHFVKLIGRITLLLNVYSTLRGFGSEIDGRLTGKVDATLTGRENVYEDAPSVPKFIDSRYDRKLIDLFSLL